MSDPYLQLRSRVGDIDKAACKAQQEGEGDKSKNG